MGYARASILPDEPVPMTGYSNDEFRISTGVLDPLYATCLALEDTDGGQILFMTIDLCKVNSHFGPQVKEAVQKLTGLPEERVLLTATHSHATVSTYANSEVTERYNQKLIGILTKLALDALKDLKPIKKMEYGDVDTYHMNFVKHYFREDGQTITDCHVPMTKSPIVGHTTEVDSLMLLMKFEVEGGEDILLCNWRGHAHLQGGAQSTLLSNDFIGWTRIAIEKRRPLRFAYFAGSGGNVNVKSRIPEEERTRDLEEFGNIMADYMESVIDHLTETRLGKIQTLAYTMEAEVNHSEDRKLPWAQAIWDQFQKDQDISAARVEAQKHGMWSLYHCQALINRAKIGKTFDIPLFAVSLGEVGWVESPVEQFDALGKYVRDNSPFKFTFVVAYSNADRFYLPTAYAYIYTCYETDTSRFQPGTGEKVAERQLAMLQELYSRK